MRAALRAPTFFGVPPVEATAFHEVVHGQAWTLRSNPVQGQLEAGEGGSG